MNDDRNVVPMKPRRGRRFRKSTRYPHLRSDGMTRRSNGTDDLQGRVA